MRKLFPKIFCVADIWCAPGDEGRRYMAILHHCSTCLTVSFYAARLDPKLKQGGFVSIRWFPSTRSEHGAIQVAGLTALSTSAINPFMTVPPGVDRRLIDFARNLWDNAPKVMRRLLMDAFQDRVRTQGGET